MVQTAQTFQQQTLSPWFTRPSHSHVAQFYTDERSLGTCALEYVYSGLKRHEICIVIATPEKLITLQKGLRRLSVDITAAVASGRYIMYDAEDLLSDFMNDRELDVQGFRAAMAALTQQVTAVKCPARIFGEMAALLRQQKNLTALQQLEHALEGVMPSCQLSLYCAYPVSDERNEYREVHRKIQETHDYIFYC